MISEIPLGVGQRLGGVDAIALVATHPGEAQVVPVLSQAAPPARGRLSQTEGWERAAQCHSP